MKSAVFPEMVKFESNEREFFKTSQRSTVLLRGCIWADAPVVLISRDCCMAPPK